MIYGDNDLASRLDGGSLQPLADGQFDIEGYRFGGPFDGVLLDSFDPGEGEWSTQDVDNPFGSNTVFGSDYLRGPEWAWEAFTNCYSIDEARAALDSLASRWRKDYLKDDAGTVQILRYRIGSRTRRVYGRARKFWGGIDARSYSGTAPVSLTFKLESNIYYDDEAQRVDLFLVPPTIGGLKAPLTSPLTTTGSGQPIYRGIPEVGGTAPVGFHAYIHGPIRNPSILSTSWRIGLNMDVAGGQIIHISTFPGRIAVEDQNGTNYAGRLSPGTRLGTARLWPGQPTALALTGSDMTLTSRASIVWRSGYKSL